MARRILVLGYVQYWMGKLEKKRAEELAHADEIGRMCGGLAPHYGFPVQPLIETKRSTEEDDPSWRPK